MTATTRSPIRFPLRPPTNGATRPHRHPLRATLLALGVALLVVAPTYASSFSSADNVPSARVTETGSGVAASGVSRRIEVAENKRALTYWTKERMRTSRPVAPHARGRGNAVPSPAHGKPVLVPASKPIAGATNTVPDAKSSTWAMSTRTAVSATSTVTSEGYWQASNTANPNAQIGRLFYQQWDPITQTWKDYNCSGTVVNSENKSVVWTAGHCVFQTNSNTWNRYYKFCPGYRNGICSKGSWLAYSQSTTPEWQNSVCTIAPDIRCTETEFLYDFGALKMNAINGVKIANWVGAHGILFNGAINQSRYLFGYPLNKSNGEYLYYCAGDNTYAFGNLRLAPCGAGGGASGGPWLSQLSSSWLGVVQSVNSHGDGTYMAGPYQGTVAQNLFSIVRY